MSINLNALSCKHCPLKSQATAFSRRIYFSSFVTLTSNVRLIGLLIVLLICISRLKYSHIAIHYRIVVYKLHSLVDWLSRWLSVG
jgi:hypothetical protein